MPGPDARVLLFQTHFFSRWCERAFLALARAVPAGMQARVLIHLPPGAPLPPRLVRHPHHVVRTDELRFAAYPGKSGGADWELWRGGHTDLILLHFWRAHPGFARYWSIEYDVRFSGDWRHFLAVQEARGEDLLAPALLRHADDPGWYNWPSLRGPGPGVAEAARAFLPVFRASGALMAAMDAAYRAGWTGHCEATWPSLALARGMAVGDLGGDGPFTPAALRGRFYSSTPRDAHLAPGTLVFKPALYRAGTRRDMLWHPVKPFFWRAELREGLRDIRRRAGVLVRAAAAAAGHPIPEGWRPRPWRP